MPPVFFCPKCDASGVRLYDYLTIIAGRRFGKSKFGSIASVEEACIPNTIGWACAPTVPKLHRYVIPAFQQLIPPEWVTSWNSEFLDLRLKNGSLIHFQTLEDPDQGRGQGLDWLWVDEICELTQRHWEVIGPSLADRRGVAFFTTTPRGYDWVYKHFYYPAETGHVHPSLLAPGQKQRKVDGFWALHAKTTDNPIFQTIEGKRRLADARALMSDLMFRQEHEADFVTFQGAIYGDCLRENHILYTEDEIREFIPEWPRIDPGRLIIIGIDTGVDHPFGAVKLVQTEKGFVVCGEYLQRHKSFKEHAIALKGLAGTTNVRYALNKNEAVASIELDQHGIRPIWQAENNQELGIERVKTWLINQQLYFYAPEAAQAVQQMKSYRFDDNYSPKDEQKRKEKVFKKDDELPDCVRYALMTWPQLPKRLEELEKKRDITKLPQYQQDSIAIMRKLESEAEKQSKEPDFVREWDFWS